MEKFPWLDKAEYPFTPRYYALDGHHLHYMDEGEGHVILFVHGTPSWSFDWRNCIKELRKSYRCIAIDHMGFGLSDKPQSYDYSTQRHSRTLEQFIQEMGLTRFTLVVHDFGGPIGLNVAIRHPEHIQNSVVLNSWLWSTRHEPEFIRLSRILKSPLLPFLYRYMNFSPRFILPASFGDHKLSRKLLRQYTRPFAHPGQRNGVLAFARSILNDQDWFEELWNARGPIRDKPMLLIWGMKDKVLLPKYLDKFASGFSHVQIRKLEGSGHFPQEEEAGEVTRYIREFISTS